MTENRFMWCSVDGGENVFIKDKESESDKAIDIKITDGKYEFVELMKTINDLNDENEQLKEENERLKSLHIDILERIVNEDFFQEIFKECLLESKRRKLGENDE